MYSFLSNRSNRCGHEEEEEGIVAFAHVNSSILSHLLLRPISLLEETGARGGSTCRGRFRANRGGNIVSSAVMHLFLFLSL